MQVLTGSQGLALNKNTSTPSVMTGIVYTSRGHVFQTFVSKRCSRLRDEHTQACFFWKSFSTEKVSSSKYCKIYLNCLKMSPSCERLNNDPNLHNESMDPAQLKKASAMQPKEKCFICICVYLRNLIWPWVCQQFIFNSSDNDKK